MGHEAGCGLQDAGGGAEPEKKQEQHEQELANMAAGKSGVDSDNTLKRLTFIHFVGISKK